MSRRKTTVKSKTVTLGIIDLHFHGAFGIDWMTSSSAQWDELCRKLAERGISGFCATTLSAPPAELLEAVTKLGRWMQARQRAETGGALPVGIHLEGPFLSAGACGAHPPNCIRPLNWPELEALWAASLGHLKILTVAPEALSTPSDLAKLVTWAKKRRVHLSLGHSTCSEETAQAAFKSGFKGLTHAWNALNFHHREPGALGAAVGNPKVSLELIIDRVHVGLTPIRWTRALHPTDSLCFISDCVPAAGLPESAPAVRFGSLTIRNLDGACRLSNGHLAGGGLLLPEAFFAWIQAESEATGTPARLLFKETIACLTTSPRKVLGLSRKIEQRLQKAAWTLGSKPSVTLF